MTGRGMPMRTLAGFELGAALTAAVLLGVAVPGAARAQTLRCEFRILQPNDERRFVATGVEAKSWVDAI